MDFHRGYSMEISSAAQQQPHPKEIPALPLSEDPLVTDPSIAIFSRPSEKQTFLSHLVAVYFLPFELAWADVWYYLSAWNLMGEEVGGLARMLAVAPEPFFDALTIATSLGGRRPFAQRKGTAVTRVAVCFGFPRSECCGMVQCLRGRCVWWAHKLCTR